ncbi:hypothetical protein P7K49_012677 [Saguinus oedipus]|uniref:Tetratricopeptide repeat protein 28 n=1 Tax=Saguinus oedipus TaxID=9490 RepID=A0ABQ9VGP4_SAGOE|nr:hypothetical protein P7K49_012677 [Saguinus oedipus]
MAADLVHFCCGRGRGRGWNHRRPPFGSSAESSLQGRAEFARTYHQRRSAPPLPGRAHPLAPPLSDPASDARSRAQALPARDTAPARALDYFSAMTVNPAGYPRSAYPTPAPSPLRNRADSAPASLLSSPLSSRPLSRAPSGVAAPFSLQANSVAVEQLRKEGNELFKCGDYEGALAAYTQALGLDATPQDQAILHRNRAACHLKLVREPGALPLQLPHPPGTRMVGMSRHSTGGAKP